MAAKGGREGLCALAEVPLLSWPLKASWCPDVVVLSLYSLFPPSTLVPLLGSDEGGGGGGRGSVGGGGGIEELGGEDKGGGGG